MERSPISPVVPATRPSTQLHRSVAQAAACFELTKPRVVALIVFTAVVGMLLATSGSIAPQVFVCATLGISLAAGAAAAFNHVLDRRADAIMAMARTRARPMAGAQRTVARSAFVEFFEHGL